MYVVRRLVSELVCWGFVLRGCMFYWFVLCPVGDVFGRVFSGSGVSYKSCCIFRIEMMIGFGVFLLYDPSSRVHR